MRNTIAFLVLILSSQAIAATSPSVCISQCKALNEEGQYRCDVIYAGGAIMSLDRVNPNPSERTKANVMQLKSCFFESGGMTFEIHDAIHPNADFQQCSPATNRVHYFCDRATMKESQWK